MTTVPDRLKGTMPRGYKSDALRRERDALIVSMSRTMSQTELAKLFQLSASGVHYLVKDANNKKRRQKTLTHVLQEAQKNTGSLKKCLSSEPVDFVNWLLSETPDGCTIAETMLAIARDAYAEAMEEKTGKVA